MKDDFVHLHVHDEYSMLDGAASIPRLIEQAIELGQPAIAETNHGNMFGTYKFVKEAKRAGIKPIVGIEAYVSPRVPLTEKRRVKWGSEDQKRADVSGGGSYTHLTLLAENETGVRNLYQLSSISYAEGFYSKPRIDIEALTQYGAGLIIGSGCLSGELATRLALGQREEASAYIYDMKERFGDSFFIEVMNHEFEREEAILGDLCEIAYTYDVPLLGTNDSHYVTSEDAILHDSMLCIQTRSKLADADRMRFDGSGYYLRTRSELDALLPKESLDNTLLVAERVQDYGDIFDRKDRFPRASNLTMSSEETLGYKSRTQLGCLSQALNSPEYHERLDYELSVITKLGFSDYFLVMSELADWARGAGMQFGPGRGSAGGSLVSYVLGITAIDPIEHDLLFERFLNEDRVAWPDIDVDIPEHRRDEFLQHVRDTYGAEYVAGICTVQKIGPKRALQDSAFVQGYSFTAGREVIDLLPPPISGRQPDLVSIKNAVTTEQQPIFDLAVGLDGLTRGTGIHASGFILSPEPLRDYVPLWNKSGKGPQTSQWDMHAMEELGAVKMDFLGLNTLSVIDTALRFIGKPVELPTNPHKARDPRTYTMLTRGDSVGVFQLDGPGMQRLLKRLKPESIYDIAAVLALYRPGPMGTYSHHKYADRKNGKEPVTYPTPELGAHLKGILAETYGVLVYQEQIIKALQVVAGYTPAQADLVRRAMGKKDREALAAEKERFYDGCVKNAITDHSIQTLWDTLVPFADYSFNKSHAVGYGYVAYWTAYLKANHTAEWFAALLSHEGDPEKAKEYIVEARRMGLAILPPSFNESDAGWTPTGKGLRYGLATIKDVGVKAIDKIKDNGPFADWPSFLRLAPSALLNSKLVGALIRAGAMDEYGSREGLLEVYQDHILEAKAEKEENSRGQTRFIKRTFTVPSRDIDYRGRAKAEKETLGTVLSTEPVRLRLPVTAGPEVYDYVRAAVTNSPGTSPLLVSCGPWEIPFGSVDPKALTALRTVGKV